MVEIKIVSLFTDKKINNFFFFYPFKVHCLKSDRIRSISGPYFTFTRLQYG